MKLLHIVNSDAVDECLMAVLDEYNEDEAIKEAEGMMMIRGGETYIANEIPLPDYLNYRLTPMRPFIG